MPFSHLQERFADQTKMELPAPAKYQTIAQSPPTPPMPFRSIINLKPAVPPVRILPAEPGEAWGDQYIRSCRADGRFVVLPLDLEEQAAAEALR